MQVTITKTETTIKGITVIVKTTKVGKTVREVLVSNKATGYEYGQATRIPMDKTPWKADTLASCKGLFKKLDDALSSVVV